MTPDEQCDTDMDGAGDACDTDDDNDGLSDSVETNTGIFVSATDTGTNPLIADTDGDGFSDGVEVLVGTDPNNGGDVPADTDSDGVPDVQDNCVAYSNADQTDTDSDGAGNRCDGDFNNDGDMDGCDRKQLVNNRTDTTPNPYKPLYDLDSPLDGAVDDSDLAIWTAIATDAGWNGSLNCPGGGGRRGQAAEQ